MSKRLKMFGEKLVKPRTAESIRKQIFVLEKKVVSLIAEGNSIKQIFALNSKIQKLKHELREKYHFNWLAQ